MSLVRFSNTLETPGFVIGWGLVVTVSVGLGVWFSDILKTYGSVIGPGLAVLVTVWLGALFGLIGKKRERKEIARALVHEVGDRAARCLHDYIDPWREVFLNDTDANMEPGRLQKFAPVSLEVYRNLGAKALLLDSRTNGKISDFHYRIESTRRDILFKAERPADCGISNRLIGQRFYEAISAACPAIDALCEELDTRTVKDILADLGDIYTNVPKNKLRETLCEYINSDKKHYEELTKKK